MPGLHHMSEHLLTKSPPLLLPSQVFVGALEERARGFESALGSYEHLQAIRAMQKCSYSFHCVSQRSSERCLIAYEAPGF